MKATWGEMVLRECIDQRSFRVIAYGETAGWVEYGEIAAESDGIAGAWQGLSRISAAFEATTCPDADG